MIEPKRSHYFTLFLLFSPAYLCADAQLSTEPSPSPPPSAAASRSDLSFSIKIVILLCTFLFISIFSFYLNHWTTALLVDHEIQTAATAVDGGDDRRRSFSQGIDREILDTFPILVYSTIKNLKIGKGDLECAVCLSEFKDHETLRLIPNCNHVFHPECIDAWLASHVTCPVCRANLSTDKSGEIAAVAVPPPSTQLNDADELVEENTEDNSSMRREASETHAVSNESESSSNFRSDTDGTTMYDEAKAKQNRSRRSRWRMLGKLSRSSSTGHSLIQLAGRNMERHTLRLPEDVRRYILLNHTTIGRCASYNVAMPMKGMGWSDSEGSSRGKRNYVERQDRWVLSATPPFVHRKD